VAAILSLRFVLGLPMIFQRQGITTSHSVPITFSTTYTKYP